MPDGPLATASSSSPPAPARVATPPAYTMAVRGQSRAGAVALLAIALAGCDPVMDIEGAFFPSWMVSLLVGVLLTVALRLAFARIGLEPYIGPPPLIYTCLALLLTMATWVMFFHV
jgi:hypothetical protein